MAAKESYRDSQENEFIVLKSIFEEVIDLRPTHDKDKWIPLDIKIKCEPQRGSSCQSSQIFCSAYLRVQAPKNYPKVAPKIYIEDTKGLSAADINSLISQLNKEAYSLKGEVCVFELAQYVQSFLHQINESIRNNPPKGSFYDEMLARKLKKNEDDKKEKEENDEKLRQKIEDERSKRKELLKKETRTRRSTLNDSPMRHLSSESSNSECKIFEVCDEHKKSDTIVLPLEGNKKKIMQGACLGHSLKGCINYSGIDYATGKLYYITEWNIKHSSLEARNLKVSEFIETIQMKVQNLIKLRHKNIVSYEGVLCNPEKESVQVFLIQEFILGISMCSMSGGCFNWNVESVSSMTKGILEGLIFLHNNGISHGNLSDSAVFLDNSGIIKISDYSVIPYLQELTSGISFEADLSSLGTLLESLIPTPHLEMRDFINECRNERTLSASSLLEHPFLYNILIPVDLQAQNDQKIASNYPPPVVQPNMNLTTPINTTTHSRLDTEFEMMNYIGQGAFGDVLKVRNILDNRQYAIKRIPLSSMNKQIFKKMTREVELLSRLNHENVVRYYNSWLETQTAPIPELEDSEDEGLSSKDLKRKGLIRTHSGQNIVVLHSTDDEDSLGKVGWNAFISDSSDDEDDDDWIEFEDSKGRVTKYDDDDNEAQDSRSDKDGKGDGTIVQRKNTILYIQMEYCDKSTLRSAIDSGLYQDRERIQKLFREMVEGLSHIHQQGMIHRDLKCENIFLDSKDHVKIGDFGLATTNVLALQYQNNETNQSLQLPKISYGDSHTGQVGTALYCAPELSQNACKSTYNQKVDLYSLGIIFFEMCHAPFGTGMERIQTLLQLRMPEIVIPKEMIDDGNRRNEVKIIRWLLDHEPSKRPTSEELLQSDLMPPAKVEVSEIQETFRHVLANPQSRSYKYLVNRILQQESEKVISSIYHTNMIFISPVFENVKIVIEQIFRKHGAIEFSTPLLTPYNKMDPDSAVRLMSHSGLIVTLPTDLRQTFLRLVAQNAPQISYLRRYAIGRTYHERKVFNQHPRTLHECAFDIITPIRGGLIVDAELLTICHEIISKFETLKQKNISFRINHTSLLRAIFLYYSVPAVKYQSVLALVEEHLEDKITKKQLISSITALIPAKNAQCVASLVDSLLVMDIPISNLSSTNLKVIIKGRGDATALAKGALRELENVVNLCQSMGVTTTIHICVNFTMGFDCTRGGIVWNLTGETKKEKKQILAYGTRYDYQLEEYQKSAQKSRELYCAGFSIVMDKLLACLNQSNECHSVVDLVVFITGARPPVKDICQIMNSLWAADIRCCFIESQDDDDIARNLGANHIFVLGEDGCIRVKSWQNERYQENSVSRAEVIDYLKKNLNIDFHMTQNQQESNHAIARNNSTSSVPSYETCYPTSGLPTCEIVFIANEKLNANKRKRLENQIEQKVQNVLHKFARKETLLIFAVELNASTVRLLLTCIDPNPKEQQSQNEFDTFLKGFPKNKQSYLQEIYDEITDRLSSNKNSFIVGIFAIPDSYYRLIL